MTTQAKHTPLPFQVKEWPVEGATDAVALVVADSRGHGIAQMLTYGRGKKPKANAAFIVRACNSHEALVEACENAVRRLCRHEYGDIMHPTEAKQRGKDAACLDVIGRCKAALVAQLHSGA